VSAAHRSLPGARQRASHEAAHAAALCVAGMVPMCARTDFPGELAGSVTLDWGDGIDRDKAEGALIAVVLGGMAEGSAGWRDWPLDRDRVSPGARGDAE